MENKLQIFTNKEFGEVRTVIIDDAIWFVAADVCRALKIANSRDAVGRLDDDEKATVGITDTSSNGVVQNREVNIINEAGLYRLIFTSRKTDAKKFQRWIFHEVIPSIRKHGFYSTQPTANKEFSLHKLVSDVGKTLKRFKNILT